MVGTKSQKMLRANSFVEDREKAGRGPSLPPAPPSCIMNRCKGLMMLQVLFTKKS